MKMGREDLIMTTRKRHTPEQVVRKLAQADRMLGEGKDIADVCRELGVSEQTYYRWRNQFGGLKTDDGKRLKDLAKENSTLKRLLADAELEKADSYREWINYWGPVILASAEHLRPVDVVSGEVSDRTAAVVFVVHPHHPGRARWQAWVAAAPGLDGSLLSRGNHKLVGSQRLALPLAGAKASTRCALLSKGGSVMKIHDWSCHGLSASCERLSTPGRS